MKIKWILGITIPMLAINIACGKEDLVVENSSANGEKNEQLKISVNPIAKQHYDLIKSAIYATGSNCRTRSNDDSNNPLATKLCSMKIETENGDPISFYDLTPEQQQTFLSAWVDIESEDLTQKMQICPELETAIAVENKIVEETMKEEGNLTRGNEIIITSPIAFFEKISKRLTEAPKEVAKHTRMASSTPEAMEFADWQREFAMYSDRGLFIVQLPSDLSPDVLLNFEQDWTKIGHASVITYPGSKNRYQLKDGNRYRYHYYPFKKGENITIGAQTGGVRYETSYSWQCPSYIMGIQDVTYKYSIWPPFVRKKITPVQNISKLADEAENYLGAGDAFWQFLWPKLAAPERFTCTSLVWYCAKKVYGIDISSWWQTIITPSALVESDNTYCVCHIQPSPF